ncbi:hypothetical protein [Neobacillus piezotolerans]|uniref:hypothetical protein n=1 Tax=Neobacillus piezotolerans TaxID=2259171 RepID=UPI001FE60C25|nr:hypothetical protein [Neobacillus piezotolerans]
MGIISFILTVVGLIFSIKFQSMAYWGPGGTFTWTWYWVGAFLSYFCLLMSIVCMNKAKNNIVLTAFNLIIILPSLLWTTFIIIAWQSGM